MLGQGIGNLGPPVAVAGVAVLGTVAVAVFDPSRAGHVLVCPLLAIGGVACPLCGGLRAVHALTQGDVGAALSFNPLLVVALPLLVVGWLAWTRRAVSRPGAVLPTWVLWAGFSLTVLFGIVRNLPPLVPWLTPWLVG